MLALVIAVIAVALIFDYTNGFHDAANAIATSVSTRALTPKVAVVLAAIMNFVGAFLGQAVANTVSETINPGVGHKALLVVLSGLVGAIIWNIATWYVGLPSSSSHALIGGLVGAALAASRDVHWHVIVSKVVIPMFLSPLAGFVGAFVLTLLLMWVFRRTELQQVQSTFRMLQTVSAAALALGHGVQDAQKTMGVIVLALVGGSAAVARDRHIRIEFFCDSGSAARRRRLAQLGALMVAANSSLCPAVFPNSMSIPMLLSMELFLHIELYLDPNQRMVLS